MTFKVLCVFAFVLFELSIAADPTHGCHGTPSLADPNNFPVQELGDAAELVATVKNGKKYVVTVPNAGGNTTSKFTLLHLYGTPEDWGEAQGTLMKKEGVEFINRVWQYFEEQVEGALPKDFPVWLQKLVADVGLDAALDFTESITKGYTNPSIYKELKAISDASGVDYKKLVNVHMIAGLTQGKCSMFGAWGDALADPNGLLQLRALDWDMDGPFRDYNQVTVYHPSSASDGHPFFLVGYTAFVGALSGMSSSQLGISEIGVSYPDDTFGKESRIGIPFVFLLRDILQYDVTIDDAISRMTNARRTCDLILGVGDGKMPLFRGFAYSYSQLTVVDDYNLIPANDTWHPKMKDIVYWGMDWMCPSFNYVLSGQLSKYYGKLTPEVAIQHITGPEGSGDNSLAYYDLVNMQAYVSMAASFSEGGNPAAYARQFTHMDVATVFAETL